MYVLYNYAPKASGDLFQRDVTNQYTRIFVTKYQ